MTSLRGFAPRLGPSRGAWLAAALLALVAGAPLADGLAGRLAYERDTEVFYLPLTTWAQGQMRAGELPFWTPQVFSGYPLFADGELGLAHPAVLAALVLLPVEAAFLLLRFLHLLVAAAGTYGLARAWQLSRAAALLAAATLALGSFFQAQLHHENVVRSGAWLPVSLACVEAALRADGRRRVRWAFGAALAIGLAGLGLHVQMLVVDLLALGLYGLGRLWVGPIHAVRPGRPGRVWAVASVVGSAAGLGVALAGVQLLPLAELAGVAARGAGLTYPEAAAYSLAPFDLARLVLPFAFRGPGDREWGLWPHWETALYVGIAPLLLALLGLGSRRPEARAWGVLALLGLLLALGQHSPLNLHQALWQLPGLGALRAPGRFTLLVVLALALLAALGLEACRRHASPRGFVVWLAAAALALAVSVPLAHGALALAPEPLLDRLAARYLAVPREDLPISPAEVIAGLAWATDVANPHTARALALLVGVAACLLLWQAGPWPAIRAWRGWPTAFGLLALADLLAFAYTLHPRATFEALARPEPAAQAIRTLLAQREAEGSQPYRVLVAPGVRRMQPDRLAGYGVEEANGYSSLPFRWHQELLERVQAVDDDLLDLWNVRYVLEPATTPNRPLTTYRGVVFEDDRRLLDGPAGGAVGEETLRLGDGTTVADVRLVAALEDAAALPQDTVVAEVRLLDGAGRALAVRELRAGREVMDWGWDVAAVQPAMRHGRVEAAGSLLVGEGRPEETRRVLSYAALTFAEPVPAARIAIHATLPTGTLAVYGAAYADPRGRVQQLGARSRAKYREVYRDAAVVVLENTTALPRAYFVPEAHRAAAPGGSLGRMAEAPFDPRDEVVLAFDAPVRPTPGPGDTGPPGGDAAVAVERYDALAVDLRLTPGAAGYVVLADPYYPGWRAYVDGVEQPIARANVLFRAVAVPADARLVQFRFAPGSVLVGAALSGGALLVALAAVFLRGGPGARGPRSGRTAGADCLGAGVLAGPPAPASPIAGGAASQGC